MDKTKINALLTHYLATEPYLKIDGKSKEVEIRFGSNARKYKPTTKMDYDNVVSQLRAHGFTTNNNDGFDSLRIFHEYTDKTTGMNMMSNIRTEIVGSDLISEYCRTNSLQKLLDMPSMMRDKLQFTQKIKPKNDEGKFIDPVDMEDFNVRISYQYENEMTASDGFIRGIIQRWTDAKKTFRYLNRVRFSHPDIPFFADLSIVRKSKTTNGGIPMKFYTFQESGVLASPESYEIEMEMDNTRVGAYGLFDTNEKIMGAIRNAVRIIMSGLQGTAYPKSYVYLNGIQLEYMKLLHGAEYKPSKITSYDFIGPSSQTMTMRNIMKIDENSNVPNIRKNYTVTDKADGDRKLLFINGEGHLFMIDTNMNVAYTGRQIENKDLFDSLLDGEHIKHDKRGKLLNLFAAFDVYYIGKKSVRELAFCNNYPVIEPNKPKPKFRLELLKQFVDVMKLSNPPNSQCPPFQVRCKTFYNDTTERTIFQGCSQILSDITDGIYEYNTDGLILTPSNTGVCSNSVGTAGTLTKQTWAQSMKWKPPEFNTIDFLVSLKKDKTGKDETHNIFQDGMDLQQGQDIIQYKTLVLRCGYDEKKHGYLNPFEDMVQNKIPVFDVADRDRDRYKPVPFQPTNPYDANACYANIILKNSQMFSEEGEYFEEDTIVEFSYDLTKPEGWRWKPLRVRYDKTTELRNGMKNYGNAYHVANSNWQTIHQPITVDMLTQDVGIPEYNEECGDETTADEGVYYNRVGDEDKQTKGLRDFHNLYVKNKLIMGVAHPNDTLIDYAVGKAGDLPKWIYSGLSFVFGIDISKDNIHNRVDGACARYLNYRKKNKKMPSALFVQGNSGNNIRKGDAFGTPKDKEISSAVFGNGPKDATTLGDGVYSQYGVGRDGFHISSCQFAFHYFFETVPGLHRFLRNLAECTRLNGYFIGTCYDGETVFKLLRDKKEGEAITIMRDNGSKMFELTKTYSETGLANDETSVGYPINVYQETIGKTFREYLVCFSFVLRIMEDYGFVLVARDEARNLGFPSGSGLFSELFSAMELETRQNPSRISDYRDAHKMTAEEKQISFMNRYFIFKKMRNVSAEKVFKARPIEELEEPEKPKKTSAKKNKEKVRIGSH